MPLIPVVFFINLPYNWHICSEVVLQMGSWLYMWKSCLGQGWACRSGYRAWLEIMWALPAQVRILPLTRNWFYSALLVTFIFRRLYLMLPLPKMCLSSFIFDGVVVGLPFLTMSRWSNYHFFLSFFVFSFFLCVMLFLLLKWTKPFNMLHPCILGWDKIG